MNKHNLHLLLRGIRELHRLSPWNLLAKCIRSLSNAALPFVNLYLSAEIINALVTGESLQKILLLVALTVGVDLGLTLISREMDAINYRKWNEFYLRYNFSIGEKMQNLPFEKQEDDRTHLLIQNLDDAMRISNYGLIKLHSRIPLFVENAVKVLFSAGFLLSTVFQKTGAAAGPLQQFMNSWPADLLLLMLVLLAVFCGIKANQRIAGRSYQLLGRLSKSNRILNYYVQQYLDSHAAGKDIRLYHQDEVILDELKENEEKSGALVSAMNRTVFHNQLWVSGTSFLLILYTYLYIGIKAISGVFAVGSMVKYSGGVLQFAGAFSGMMDALSQLKANSPYLADYFRYLDLPSENAEEDSLEENPEIKVEQVSFCYPGRTEKALEEISLTIHPQETVAIVGPNGSGKTTLVKLLCGLYEPTSGSVSKTIRGHISVVFQDFKLFSFQLGQNVAGAASYDEEKVIQALQKAGFTDRLQALPAGTETWLYKNFDENGIEISGGETQKIAIARALYHDQPILILDEPTAALDPLAESEIYERLGEVTKDKTVIFISHRLSSCRFCDRILVLDQGRLVQQGTHEELLAEENGLYHRLWTSQAQYYENVF